MTKWEDEYELTHMDHERETTNFASFFMESIRLRDKTGVKLTLVTPG